MAAPAQDADEMRRSALLSPCSRFRYYLERRWRHDGPVAVFVLCNPSTADAEQDDATVRKCVGFAKRWDCAAMVIVNPFAFRSRDPKALLAETGDITGGIENARWMLAAVEAALSTGGPYVVGWGEAMPRRLRAVAVDWVRGVLIDNTGDYVLRAQCLGRTASGQPRHPLMLAYDTPLQPFHTRMRKP